MKSNLFSNVFGTEKKYRAKMVKGKHGWLVKGMLFGTLLLGSVAFSTIQVDAAEWSANSVEQIANRITEDQKSIKMIEGDTVYNIGLAINIKDPMQLLYDNGFKDNEQYTLPIGTVISWDGNHVTVTDPQGNVIGDAIVTDDQKHNPNQPVAGQSSDTPRSQSTSNSSSTAQATKPQAPITDNSTNGNQNDDNESVIPEQPVNPVDPEQPIVPEQPDNQTELEKLKILLAQLEEQLQIAEQELAIAQQNLENAKSQASIDYDTEIANLQSSIAEKDANRATIQNDITNLEIQQATAQGDLIAVKGHIKM